MQFKRCFKCLLELPLTAFKKRFAHIEKYAAVIQEIDSCIKPKAKRAA